MPAFSATAPGKVILFGEHAVVYGQPAIAAPVAGVAAKAVITPDISALKGRVLIEAPQISLAADLNDLPADNPVAAAVSAALGALEIDQPPAFKLRVNSTIPIAGGLGSGAAVSVAILRAVSAFLGHPFTDEQASALAFEVEKLHHGTPSGIDNTVIAFGKPVYFVKGQPPEFMRVEKPLQLVIADTGKSTPTRVTVGAVRAAWQADEPRSERIFEKIGALAKEARKALEAGDNEDLGLLMNSNHELLLELDVSSPELDALVAAAHSAGALGAKLSGGGRGGNVIAVCDIAKRAQIRDALLSAGAIQVIETTIG